MSVPFVVAAFVKLLTGKSILISTGHTNIAMEELYKVREEAKERDTLRKS